MKFVATFPGTICMYIAAMSSTSYVQKLQSSVVKRGKLLTLAGSEEEGILTIGWNFVSKKHSESVVGLCDVMVTTGMYRGI